MEPQELLGHLLMAGLGVRMTPDGQKLLLGLMNSLMKGRQGNGIIFAQEPIPFTPRPTFLPPGEIEPHLPDLHDPDTVGREAIKAGRGRDPNAPAIWGDSNWGQHKWGQKGRELKPSPPTPPPAGYQGSGSLNPFTNNPFSIPHMGTPSQTAPPSPPAAMPKPRPKQFKIPSLNLSPGVVEGIEQLETIPRDVVSGFNETFSNRDVAQRYLEGAMGHGTLAPLFGGWNVISGSPAYKFYQDIGHSEGIRPKQLFKKPYGELGNGRATLANNGYLGDNNRQTRTSKNRPAKQVPISLRSSKKKED